MPLRSASLAEKIGRDRLTHAEWGAKLSPEQFLRREEILRDHAWARENMTTWFWTDDQDRVLASCEIFRMASLCRSERGSSYGIASVYTEPALRGHGHASRMLAELPRAVGTGHALILFSEVGDAIYRRAGFEPRESFERVFEAKDRRPRGSREPALLDRPAALSRVDRLTPPREPFVIWPSSDQVDWHFAREGAYSLLLNRPRPGHSGAGYGNSLIIWAMDYKAGHLQILFFHAESAAEAEILLATAIAEAGKMAVPTVRAWESESPGLWDRLAIPSAREPSDGALAMLRPLVPSVNASDWNVISRSLWI